ncbi:hydrolase [Gluconacetobacter azotocaptans]|uniref:Hydrolase n=1 Tax=Gluconacetobacter azotocaptans TaxID=142834 RepID=A0A7W4JPL0_9PROT|nr:hydrolase [Gluconacetobacter azotocaptans]MBB2188493.1 hydrolase [Gluconacetobacter azotocaptans]MBM9400198.1 hydrolase [Gluconacetobacter azotocaptans]GBQ27993.1 isochorismatase hydrolase [Gluconacetobacter azotocaptans DSM 13594]
MPTLDPRTTALVLIDLQNGITGLPLAPRSGDEVLETSRRLAARFRQAGAPVVLVRVAFSADFGDAPPQNVDAPTSRAALDSLRPDWSTLAEGLAQPTDIVVTKRQWGAFYGTELDLQLRRRGIRTIVLGGVATNFGVESTLRHAWELGYDVVVAEDACASRSSDLHDMAIRHIFPRLSRVTDAASVTLAVA